MPQVTTTKYVTAGLRQAQGLIEVSETLDDVKEKHFMRAVSSEMGSERTAQQATSGERQRAHHPTSSEPSKRRAGHQASSGGGESSEPNTKQAASRPSAAMPST